MMTTNKSPEVIISSMSLLFNAKDNGDWYPQPEMRVEDLGIIQRWYNYQTREHEWRKVRTTNTAQG